MRVSDIQRRRSQPAEAPVPRRRTIGWLVIAILIGIGVYLYFRHAHTVVPLVEGW